MGREMFCAFYEARQTGNGEIDCETRWQNGGGGKTERLNTMKSDTRTTGVRENIVGDRV